MCCELSLNGDCTRVSRMPHFFFQKHPQWRWGLNWATNEDSPTNYVLRLGYIRLYFWFGR